MRLCRTLIPLLVVFLAVQGAVAGVPHQHGSECLVGHVIGSASTVDEPHHCLACSVHAPAMASTMLFGFAFWIGENSADLGFIATIRTSPSLISSGPRGPPSA